MKDEVLPLPTGEEPLPPIPLSPEQKELCKRLDELYSQLDSETKPSDMFRGAIFAIRTECQTNPDRIAQAAHSLREILYHLYSGKKKHAARVLKKYGSVVKDDGSMKELGRVYGHLCDLAHHKLASNDLDDLHDTISDLQGVMQRAMTRQIDLHKKIDQIVSSGPE